MKTYWGSGSITPRLLNLGTRWRWVVSFTLRPLYPRRESPWYSLNRRIGGPQSRSGRGCINEKKSLLLPEIQLRSSSPQPNHYTDMCYPHPCYMHLPSHSLCWHLLLLAFSVMKLFTWIRNCTGLTFASDNIIFVRKQNFGSSWCRGFVVLFNLMLGL